MSEEASTIDPVEPSAAAPETSSPADSSPAAEPAEGDVESSAEAAVEERFLPWELEAKHEETQQVEGKIPYDRFRVVNEERKAFAAENQRLQQELQQLQQRQVQVDKVKTPAEIKLEDYATVDEWVEARDKATQAAISAQLETAFLQREQQRVQQEQNNIMVQRFDSNVSRAVEANPEVKAAVDWLDRYAEHLHPSVARELLLDENAGHVIHKIVTDKQALAQLFRGNPADTIRMLHRTSARFDVESKSAPAKKSAGPDLSTAPSATPKPGSTLTVRTGGKPPTKDPSKMSHAEYRKWRGFDK